MKYGGRNDVLRHFGSDKHKSIAAAQSSTKPGGLGAYFARTTDDDVIKAERLYTGYIIEHNLPVSASDHADTCFSECFLTAKLWQNITAVGQSRKQSSILWLSAAGKK